MSCNNNCCNNNCCNTNCNNCCTTSNTCATTTNCTSTCIRGPCGPCGACGPTGATGATGATGPAGAAGTNASPNLKYITSDASFDYSAETTSFNIILNSSTAIGTGAARQIKLPQPTAANAGLVVKIIVSHAPHTASGVRIGFSNAGSAVMKGAVIVISTTAEQTEIEANASTKTIHLVENAATQGGGAGTEITIVYCALDIASVSGNVTTSHANPAPTPGALLSATGWV